MDKQKCKGGVDKLLKKKMLNIGQQQVELEGGEVAGHDHCQLRSRHVTGRLGRNRVRRDREVGEGQSEEGQGG